MIDFHQDIDVIRRRPGMFIGDVRDGSGLLHMVWELLANTLDEHVRGSCRAVSVEVGEDGSVTVRDDGRGIPVDQVDGVPFVQKALTTLHRTPTFDGHAPHEHVGLHGVGLVAVNALSSWLSLEIFRDARCYRQRYERGIPCGALEAVGSTSQTGTAITFLPDPTIFSDPWINAGAIAARLRELACLVPTLSFSFVDHRKHHFHETRGIRAFLERTRSSGKRIFGVVVVEDVVGDISVEVAMEWRDHRRSSIDSYANIQRTTEGGTHVHGLLDGLARGLRDVEEARVNERSPQQLRDIVDSGLHAVVCVRLRDPAYHAPTKNRLETPEVATVVSAVVRRAFAHELRHDAELRSHIVGQIERVEHH